MQYMNPLVPEDLVALNELAKLTWAWELRYWTEKGVEHGSFILNALDTKTLTWYRVDGATIAEAVDNFIIKITSKLPHLTIPDFP